MKEKFITFVSSLWQMLVSHPSRSLTYAAIFLAIIVAIFLLSSCSAYTALNQTLRYEYKLSRESNVQTQTNLKITNEQQ